MKGTDPRSRTQAAVRAGNARDRNQSVEKYT